MFVVFIMEILALVIMGLGAAGLLFEVLSETAGKTPSSTNARHVVETWRLLRRISLRSSTLQVTDD